MSEKLRHVNAVLLKLSQDDDLHDDFKLPSVQAAIDHWTNRKRLDAENAQKLQNDRRVVYVLQRFQMLQSVCQQAGMPVPLDHLLLRKTEVDPNLVKQYFKDEPVKSSEPAKVVKSEVKAEKKVTPAAPGVAAAAAPTTPKNITKPVDTAQQKTEAPVAEPVSSSAVNTPVVVEAVAKAGGLSVNDVLKFFIALTFVMIGVVLSQLWK